MKNFKRLIAVALTAAMVAAVPAAAATEKVTWPALTTTSGIQRSVNGFAARYREGGKWLRRTWKKVKEYGTWYWFYFDANTLAARAKAYPRYANNVASRTINGTHYGFDMYGHRVSGVWASAPANGASGKFFAFKADGTYDKTLTKKLRGLATFNKRFDVSVIYAENNTIKHSHKTNYLYGYLEKIGYTPNEVQVLYANARFNGSLNFGALQAINPDLFAVLNSWSTVMTTAYRYVYDTFEVYTVVRPGKGEIIVGVTAITKW